MEKVKHLGKTVYLPLSVDVEDVKRYRREKDRYIAFVGRRAKRGGRLFDGADLIENMPRPELLTQMARYQKVYAVGRTAIEAKVLDCEVLPYDDRFPDPSRWKIYDTLDVVPLLQRELDIIDK